MPPISTNKFICIHGHFYQPPRENAWLDCIEHQPDAAPFTDWNARIQAECYAPNANARLLDAKGRILSIVSNYRRMSFNMGATLLSWMETEDPNAYAAILEADRLGCLDHNGHGPAMAQVHSHLIMPLCNDNDRETQILWGITDFVHRFKRQPEGMWLAETAVDTQTLEAFARNGIKFTVLAPRQCKGLRKTNADAWIPTHASGYDTRIPYKVALPSGRSIAVFFYNGDISQKIAFGGALNDGKAFAADLLHSFSNSDRPEIVHVATDGESYGHHHRYGEMALAACFEKIALSEKAEVINYAAFLALFPVTHEAQIVENSSWSCEHGVERWRSNCGCSTGGGIGWHQRWRKPLRDALDLVRDGLAPFFEAELSRWLTDPWAARNDYAALLLDNTPQKRNGFLKRHSVLDRLTDQEKIQVWQYLEMQRYCILMYTSCGWFFNDASGIETIQILQYADRAMVYAAALGLPDIQNAFVSILGNGPINDPKFDSIASVYLQKVLPLRQSETQLVQHFAVEALLHQPVQTLTKYGHFCRYSITNRHVSGPQVLVIGQLKLKSIYTDQTTEASFALLQTERIEIAGGLRINMASDDFLAMQNELKAAFTHSNSVFEMAAVFHRFFKLGLFSIKDLLVDERNQLITLATSEHVSHIEQALRDIYHRDFQMMDALQKNEQTVPQSFLHAAHSTLLADLQLALKQPQTQSIWYEDWCSNWQKWEVAPFDNNVMAPLFTAFFFQQTLISGSATAQDLMKIDTLFQPFGLDFDRRPVQNNLFARLKNSNVVAESWMDLAIQFGLDAEFISSEKTVLTL